MLRLKGFIGNTLGAYSCFLANMLSGPLDSTECFVLAVLMYYFYLAVFFWMLNIAANVARTLRLATTQLRYTGLLLLLNALPFFTP